MKKNSEQISKNFSRNLSSNSKMFKQKRDRSLFLHFSNSAPPVRGPSSHFGLDNQSNHFCCALLAKDHETVSKSSGYQSSCIQTYESKVSQIRKHHVDACGNLIYKHHVAFLRLPKLQAKQRPMALEETYLPKNDANENNQGKN